jgi:hypothetical protein
MSDALRLVSSRPALVRASRVDARLARFTLAGWNINLDPDDKGRAHAYHQRHGSVSAAPSMLLGTIGILEGEPPERQQLEELGGPQAELPPGAPPTTAPKGPRLLFSTRTTSGNFILCNGCLSRYFAAGALYGDHVPVKLSALLALRPASPAEQSGCYSCDPVPPSVDESSGVEGSANG